MSLSGGATVFLHFCIDTEIFRESVNTQAEVAGLNGNEATMTNQLHTSSLSELSKQIQEILSAVKFHQLQRENMIDVV